MPPVAKNETAHHWPPLPTTAHPILCLATSRKGFGKPAVDYFLSTSLSTNGLKTYEFLRAVVSRRAVGGSAYSPPLTAAETSPQACLNVDFLLGLCDFRGYLLSGYWQCYAVFDARCYAIFWARCYVVSGDKCYAILGPIWYMVIDSVWSQ